jgi:hypothetical protein
VWLLLVAVEVANALVDGLLVIPVLIAFCHQSINLWPSSVEFVDVWYNIAAGAHPPVIGKDIRIIDTMVSSVI